MKIIFESSVLLERRWYPIVDVIMLLVEDSRHALAPETSDIILTSEWLKERSIDTRELVRLSITGRSYDDLVDKTSVTLDAHCRRGGRVDFSAFNTHVHPLDAVLWRKLWGSTASSPHIARADSFSDMPAERTCSRDRRLSFQVELGRCRVTKAFGIVL